MIDYLATLTNAHPLVLLLDDLHWADPASLDLLRFTSRHLADFPLILLAAYREDDLTRRHPLYQLLPTLAREASAPRLDLRRLSIDAVGKMVASRYALLDTDAARLVGWLHTRAEGNSFFTTQLLRALEDDGTLRPGDGVWSLGDLGGVGLPMPLRQVLDARVDRIGDEARERLALAAVIGHEVSLSLWTTVANTDEEDLFETIQRAVEARLLEVPPAGDAVRFAHALVREALYESILPMRRRRIHLRLGETFESLSEADPDAVAFHFQQASDDRAGPWLVQAGDRAQRAYAWLTAAARYEAALPLLERAGADPAERGWLLYRLARMHRFADQRRALGYLGEAARLAADVDRALAVVVGHEQAFCRLYLGDAARGLAELEAGVAALEALPPDELARLRERAQQQGLATLGVTRRRGTLAMWLANTGHFAQGAAMAERWLAEEREVVGQAALTDTAHGDAFNGLALVSAVLGRPAKARSAYARARESQRASGNLFQLWTIPVGELLLLAMPYEADRPAARRRLLTELKEALPWAQSIQGEPTAARATAFLGHYLDARWPEARQLARERAGMIDRSAVYYQVRLAREQGDREEAWAAVREAIPAGTASAPGTVSWSLVPLMLLHLAATLAIDAGDFPTAHAWLETHDRWLVWSGAVLGQAEGTLAWAAYHRAAGALVEALDCAEQALVQSSDPRQPLAILAAHRLLGELETADGRYAEAQAHLDQSLALAEVCAMPYERALSLLAQAELRLAVDDRDGARMAISQARDLLGPLEARPALTRAESLAASLDYDDPPVRPSPDESALPAGLSTREVEVLRLVATGLTNAQAAERLYLSPRTVDQHLRSIYNKLGVSSRVAASRWAAEHDLA